MNEYLKTCFFADKLFNEYFDNYIFRKNVLEIMNLDINTQNKNEYIEISMIHHIYFYKKLRLIYDQFGNHLFNIYCCNIILNNLNDLHEYIGEEDYEIIINMYMNIYEFEKGKEKIKRKDTIRDIMINSKYLCMDVINNIIKYL